MCAKTERTSRAQMEDARDGESETEAGGGEREIEGERERTRREVMVHVNGIRGNINTAGLSNEPECDLRIFQRAGGLA